MKKLNKNIYKTHGITLIALIVTMIVILILLGILIESISNNGILSKTNLGVRKYNFSKAEESLKLKLENIMAEYLNTNLKNLDDLNVDGYTTSISNNGRIVTLSNSKGTYKFLVDDKYNITRLENSNSKTEKNLSSTDKDYINENIKNNSKIIFDFPYTGNVQTFSAPFSGIYKIELWGARGGRGYGYSSFGNGAYVSGNLKITSSSKLYIYVGQAGNDNNERRTSWNGGGIGGADTYRRCRKWRCWWRRNRCKIF